MLRPMRWEWVAMDDGEHGASEVVHCFTSRYDGTIHGEERWRQSGLQLVMTLGVVCMPVSTSIPILTYLDVFWGL